LRPSCSPSSRPSCRSLDRAATSLAGLRRRLAADAVVTHATAHSLRDSFEPLSDGVVMLRRLAETDIPAVTASVQDPQIPHWTRVPSPYSEDDARQYVRHVEEAWRAGGEACLAIVDTQSGDLVGAIGLVIEWQDKKAEIGYWVAASARRSGVATRAVHLLSCWAFSDLGLYRLEIVPDVENEASIAVARACGFAAEGVLRGNTLVKGRRGDSLLFSLLATDAAALELTRRP
jgi:RimJ/RimL family protein N-acetyltransferase